MARPLLKGWSHLAGSFETFGPTLLRWHRVQLLDNQQADRKPVPRSLSMMMDARVSKVRYSREYTWKEIRYVSLTSSTLLSVCRIQVFSSLLQIERGGWEREECDSIVRPLVHRKNRPLAVQRHVWKLVLKDMLPGRIVQIVPCSVAIESL